MSAPADAPQSLAEAFAAIPDPRNPLGRRHSLSALLSLLAVGFAAGCNTMTAIVAFGRARPALRRSLGFTHEKPPSQSTYCRLFEKLNVQALHSGVLAWLSASAAARKGAAASVDGKTMRGTSGHYLHVFLQDYRRLVDSWEVGSKQNEPSAFECELDSFLARHPSGTVQSRNQVIRQTVETV